MVASAMNPACLWSFEIIRLRSQDTKNRRMMREAGFEIGNLRKTRPARSRVCVQAAPICQLASMVSESRFEPQLGYRVVAKSLPDDLNAANLWRSVPHGLTLRCRLMATDHREKVRPTFAKSPTPAMALNPVPRGEAMSNVGQSRTNDRAECGADQ